MNYRGRVTVSLLLFVAGLGLGAIVGSELVRLFYRNARQSADQSFSQPPTVSDQSLPLPRTMAGSPSLDNSIVDATRTVSGSVVGIVVTQLKVVRDRYSGDFFDFFFGPESMPRLKQVESMGSGFVFHDKGLILTNYHVIEHARTLYVNFPDGRQIEGEVVGYDEPTDLAIVKVTGEGFDAAILGNSEMLSIGQWAIAIGNPFGYLINDAHPTVTVGVISALNRNFAPAQRAYYQGMIQTDAAINPGNSGGPLVDVHGRVIGINTFIYTGGADYRGSIGIGFAIPINRAKRIARELIAYGRRRPFWDGIYVQDLSRSIALSLGLSTTEGVVIVKILNNSPADKAGLQPRDVIYRMGNRHITSTTDVNGVYLDYFVGDTVNVGYIRNNRKHTTQMILRENPSRKQ